MINADCFVVDIDGTLCELLPRDADYASAIPRADVIAAVNTAYGAGKRIILFTARGMRSFAGDVAAIDAFHRPILVKWLNEHGVLYHELHFGKPWSGVTYYVDDHAMLIDDFLKVCRV